MGLFDGAVVVSAASPNPAGPYTPRTDFTSECTRRHAARFWRQYVNLRFPGPPRWSVPKGISSGYLVVARSCALPCTNSDRRLRNLCPTQVRRIRDGSGLPPATPCATQGEGYL